MLFLKECKKTVCSLTFVLYAATVVIMYITQFCLELQAPLHRPQPQEATYESVIKEMPEQIMPAATESLLCEYLEGNYTAYPFLFYKSVKLKEEKRLEMAEILEELTGLDKQELDAFTEYEPAHQETFFDEEGNLVEKYYEAVLPEYEIPEALTYERFRELMEQADKIIGGGSNYSDQSLLTHFSQVPMSYEEALAEYENTTDEKNVAESYIRLFCDYMGIALSVLPVFVCAGFWQADKRNRMEQLVYSRKISSAKLICTRYLAMLCCMFVPVLITLVHALSGVAGLYPEKNIAIGNAVMLAVVWLFPTLMTVSALGVFLSELCSPFLAIFVQGIWWYTSLSANELTGSITKYTLLIRHNTIGSAALFEAQKDNFIYNRSASVIFALFMLGASAFLYHKARKGGFFHGNQIIRKNSNRKSAA